MPKRIAPLSDARVSKAKPTDKEYKIADGGGLHLLVTPSGGKLWRLKYRFDGKEKLLAFGSYPEISLAIARQRRLEARMLLATAQDPGEVKKSVQKAATIEASSTFELVADEWYEKNKTVWSTGHATTVKGRLKKDVFPAFGGKPVTAITASDVRTMLLKIEARGATETAIRIKIICGQVFRYAVATGRMENDPSATLKSHEIFRKRVTRHHAAVTDPKELAPLLFVRPGELHELDLEAALWLIPAERMKMRLPHVVPLAKQALEVFKALQPVTGSGRYVFPGRTSSRPMSDNSVNAALRYLGFDRETVTGHGFRATARTILDEVLGFRVDLIEHQLAHAVRDPNGRAYNRSSFIYDRRQMMQAWADYLERLRVEST